MKIATFAGIDIGSNAIRLLIKQVDLSLPNPDFKKVAYLRVPIRLGEDVFSKGEISEEKKSRLCDAMQGFSYILKAYNVNAYKAFATSAMRDARNGEEIVDLIALKSGIQLEIISGQIEAEMIYEAGSLGKLMNIDRNYLYVDVGGGSTEIVVYSNHAKIASNSFQMGTVRFLLDAVEENEIKSMKNWLSDIYKPNAPLSIIGSGGNINKINKILGKREGEYIRYTELKILYKTLKDMSFEERMLNYKLNNYRADVIVPALQIFLTIAKTCKVKEIYVPKVGLVDGIIYHLYKIRNTDE